MVVCKLMDEEVNVNGATRKALIFYCEGCKGNHRVFVDTKVKPSWSWNGDLEKPTLKPSIKVTYSRDGKCCHSFVTNGMIKYLGDCYHELKNKTIPLTEIKW